MFHKNIIIAFQVLREKHLIRVLIIPIIVASPALAEQQQQKKEWPCHYLQQTGINNLNNFTLSISQCWKYTTDVLNIRPALFIVLIITFEQWRILECLVFSNSKPKVTMFIPLSSLTKAQFPVKKPFFNQASFIEIQHLFTETCSQHNIYRWHWPTVQ